MSADAFATRVLDWFGRHGRKDLPWQQDLTPYRVWVSEIMLQQTQVATVIPYYRRFMDSYPDACALAAAGSDDVLHHWSGLGYYARARNLHEAAKIVCDQRDGVFPTDFDEVVALPGVGRSTAGAILSLALGQRHAILDGNVKRVLARHHALAGWPGASAVAAALWDVAERHTPADRVAEYNQAMMDLGATLCTRGRPRCGECPVAASCIAHREGRETEFPGRKPKKAKRRERTCMILARSGSAVYLERRPPSGLWGGLWSFPEIEPGADVADWCMARFAAAPGHVETWDVVQHSFTHFDLEIEPVVVRLAGASRKVADGDAGGWIDLARPGRRGLAAPVTGLIGKLQERENDVTNG